MRLPIDSISRMPRIAPSRWIKPARLLQLEQRMQSYYSTIHDYPAFDTHSHHPLEWRHVLTEVRRLIGDREEHLTILEFGCGRSGFPSWLRDQLAQADLASAKLEITCQDVTATNQIWLNQVADHVLIKPLQEGVLHHASFDIIFGTHCLEHVARPEQLLTTLQSLLRPGGALFLFAPRYDLPFYLSPSSQNLSILERIPLSFRLMAMRCLTILCRQPAFVIDTDPACLNRPFVRDADAIHWVSALDLRLFARRNRLAYCSLDVSHRVSPLSKQGLIDGFCKLAVRLQKASP